MANFTMIAVFVTTNMVIWLLEFLTRRREYMFAKLLQANEELNKKCIALCKSQYEGIRDILEKAATSKNPDKIESMYKIRLNEQISLFSDEKRQEEREKLIDNNTGGLITSLRRDFPNLKDLDIKIVTYSLMGFDATLISLLTGISADNYYTRKSRLKGRIQNSQITDKDRYLRWLFP